MGSAVYISVTCWAGAVPCGVSSVSMGSDVLEGIGDESSLMVVVMGVIVEGYSILGGPEMSVEI